MEVPVKPMPRYTGMDCLHPTCVRLFVRLYEELDKAYVMGQTEHRFKPFETYRSPERQLFVYNQKKSKALPFKSPHQYGLAADFVPYNGVWYWDIPDRDWDFLRMMAIRCGLDAPITWDRAHVEMPTLWAATRAALVF